MYHDVINNINKKNFAEAEKILKPLILNNPKNSKGLYLMGYIYLKLNKIDESLKYFHKASKLEQSIENLFAYAELLTRTKNFSKSEKVYKKILLKDKRNEPSLVNLAYIYLLLKDYKKSEKYYLQALDLNNNNPHYYKNLGNLYKRQNKLDEALKFYQQGIKINPNDYEIKKGIGLVMLSQKKYETGWKYFESRLLANQNKSEILLKVKNNIFSGSEITLIKKLVVISEQGIGDKILFSSIYNELLGLNIDLKFVIDPRLEIIFRRSFGDNEYIHQENIKRIGELVKEEYKFIYAGSLGKFFRKNIKDFNGKPFFKPNEEKINEYQSVLQKYKYKKYIGISWKSSSQFRGKKSFELNDFKPIIENKDIGIVNLQYGKLDDLQKYNLKNEKKIIQIKNLDLYNEFDNIISLIYCLDLVVTSPNVTVHLTGSVGKRCIAFYHREYDSIFNSVSHNKNEWYENLEIIQFKNNFESKIKEVKDIIK